MKNKKAAPAAPGPNDINPNPGPATPPVVVPDATGAEKEFLTFSPLAAALPANEVTPCKADVHVAHLNVLLGIAAVSPSIALIKTDMPTISIDKINALPQLALAFVYAAAQTGATAGGESELGVTLKQARKIRKHLLASAKAAATAGVIPAAEVERIQRGRGPFDAAQDCIDLAALHRKYGAAIAGRTMVTADDINKSAALGTLLLAALRSAKTKAPRPVDSDVAAASLVRDQLWALLNQYWTQLWKAGAFLFGPDAIDQKVPRLRSNVKKPHKKASDAKETTATVGTQSATAKA